MKKILFGALALLSMNAFGQNVNIPDANFKAALLDHGVGITGADISVIDLNGDGDIQLNEAQSYSGRIALFQIGASDLTGIEAFINLTQLNCTLNGPTISMDLSSNLELSSIVLSSVQINSLDLSNNPNLINVYCSNTTLSSLNLANGNNGTGSNNLNMVNVTQNSDLLCIQHDTGFDPTSTSGWTKGSTTSWSTDCSTCTQNINFPDVNFKNALLNHGNSITGFMVSPIDIDGDGEICYIEANAYTGAIVVANKGISDLTGLNAFHNITRLDCSYNNAIEILNVSENTKLHLLNCSGISIVNLDISSNSLLSEVYCANNIMLETLNLANGNNNNLITVQANSCSSLNCIQHDSGFNPTSNTNWQKDATASWSDDCQYPVLVNSITVQGQGGVSAITTPAGTLQMEATVLPANADNITYAWSVSNGTGSATIDANGLLTASADGTVEVIATANDGSGITGSKTITISNQSASIIENNIYFSIVPNPTSGLVAIDTEAEISSVEILSTSGQQVASFDTKVFDISTLQSGVYFVKVLSDGGSLTTRIIKE